jgi:CO/xanthine dehydrogenase FAD-binding subunit
VLGAVSPTPIRAYKAEALLKGKLPDETLADAVGLAAVADAKPLAATKYKVQLVKTMVKRALLSIQ